ncbi:MAG: hypothetical protein K0U74_13700 [Alphaproteobacteria bacterium]|nr:hypothetical protein [Alphaproteobacteria bacterium]
MNMQNIITVVVLAAIGGYFFLGDSGGSSRADLLKVLDRTQASLQIFQDHLKKNNVTKVSKENLDQLAVFMQRVMNKEPAVYPSPVGVKIEKDTTFLGFKDANKDNVKDAGESTLFKVEIDFEGKRLIASDGSGGGFTGMGLASGFLLGALMGNLMNRQRAAGVKPGSFRNRNVQSRSSYARSKARSGGRFGGK